MVGSGLDVKDKSDGTTGAGAVRVSCIIPTLNRGAVVVRTIEQLFAQTATPEVIIVDQTAQIDPATKSTLSGWNDEKRIRWVRQIEPNASKARNTGALLAIGDVLLFLDDDIEIDRGFVAAHAANYRDPSVVAVAGQVLETERVVATTLSTNPDDPDIGWIRFPKNYGARCATTWMASGNFSIRRAAYLEIGGMDENYVRGAFREESDFAMRFVKAGCRFQFDPNASITHLGVRQVPGGGARSWKDPFEIHHFIGDWYFNFKHLNRRNASRLLWYSFRHLVTSQRKLRRPWLAVISAITSLVALPIAGLRRFRGPKLISSRHSDPRETRKQTLHA
jgi:GT2 family glycosyltransferase